MPFGCSGHHPPSTAPCRSRVRQAGLKLLIWDQRWGRKEASLQFPCQLGWLIFTHTHSNKNWHLHNTGGSPRKHFAGMGKARLSLRSRDTPVPWREAPSCQGAIKKGPLPLLGWWLTPRWGAYKEDNTVVGVSTHLPGSSPQTKTPLATRTKKVYLKCSRNRSLPIPSSCVAYKRRILKCYLFCYFLGKKIKSKYYVLASLFL